MGQCRLAALFAVRTDNGRGRFKTDADRAALVDIGTLGRNPADNFLGSHRFSRRFIGHWDRPRGLLALCIRSRNKTFVDTASDRGPPGEPYWTSGKYCAGERR